MLNRDREYLHEGYLIVKSSTSAVDQSVNKKSAIYLVSIPFLSLCFVSFSSRHLEQRFFWFLFNDLLIQCEEKAGAKANDTTQFTLVASIPTDRISVRILSLGCCLLPSLVSFVGCGSGKREGSRGLSEELLRELLFSTGAHHGYARHLDANYPSTTFPFSSFFLLFFSLFFFSLLSLIIPYLLYFTPLFSRLLYLTLLISLLFPLAPPLPYVSSCSFHDAVFSS